MPTTQNKIDHYLPSDQINVFPAAFRDTAYQKARFTTEENLTTLSTITDISNLRDYAFSYNDNADIRLFLHGYRFDFKQSELRKILGKSESADFDVYALIHLSENGHTNIGPALAACGSSMVASANAAKSASEIQVMSVTTDDVQSISIEHILDKYPTAVSGYREFLGLCFILDEKENEAAINSIITELGTVYYLKLSFKGNVLVNKILTLDSSNIQNDKEAGKSINKEFSTNTLILKNPSTPADKLNFNYEDGKLIITKNSSSSIEIPIISPQGNDSYNYIWCKRGTVDEWVSLIQVGVGNLVNNYTYIKDKYSSFADFLNHVYSSAIPDFMRATFGKSIDTYLSYRGLVPIHLSIDSSDTNLPIGFTKLSNNNISGLFQYEFVKNPKNTIKVTITFNINEPDNVVAEYKLSLFAMTSDRLCDTLPNWLITGDIYYQDATINVNDLTYQFFGKLQEHSKIRIHLPKLQTKQYFYYDGRLEDVDAAFITKHNLSTAAYTAFTAQMNRSASVDLCGGVDFARGHYDDGLVMWYNEDIDRYLQPDVTAKEHWGFSNDGIDSKPFFYNFSALKSHSDSSSCRKIHLKTSAESCIDISKLDILTISIQDETLFLNISNANKTFKFNPKSLFDEGQIYLPWAFECTCIENNNLTIKRWNADDYDVEAKCYWSLCLQSYQDDSTDDVKLIQGTAGPGIDSNIGNYFNYYFNTSICEDINFIINPNGFAANEYRQIKVENGDKDEDKYYYYFNYEALNAVNHLNTSGSCGGWIYDTNISGYNWLECGLFHNESYYWEEVKYIDSSNNYSVRHGDVDIVSGSLQRYCEDLPAGTSRDFVCVSGEMDIATSYPYFKYDADTLFKKGSDNQSYYSKYILPFYKDSNKDNPPQFMLPVGPALTDDGISIDKKNAALDEHVFGNEEFCFIDDLSGTLEGQTNRIQGRVVKSHDNTIELSLTDTSANNHWYRPCVYQKDIDKYWWGLWQLVGHMRIEVGHIPADSKYGTSEQLTYLGEILWARVKYKPHRKLFALMSICENSCISISFDGGERAYGSGGHRHNNDAHIVTANNPDVIISRWSYGMLTIKKHSPADRYLYNNLYHQPCNATLVVYPVFENYPSITIVMHDSDFKYTDNRLEYLLSFFAPDKSDVNSLYYKYKLSDGTDGGYVFNFNGKKYHYNINHKNTSMLQQSYTVRGTI